MVEFLDTLPLNHTNSPEYFSTAAALPPDPQGPTARTTKVGPCSAETEPGKSNFHTRSKTASEQLFQSMILLFSSARRQRTLSAQKSQV